MSTRKSTSLSSNKSGQSIYVYIYTYVLYLVYARVTLYDEGMYVLCVRVSLLQYVCMIYIIQ